MSDKKITENKILFTFDSVICTDIGYAWVVKEKLSEEYYKEEIFKNSNSRVLYYVLNRFDYNPLYNLIKNPDEYDLDSLQKELYEAYSDEIFSHSMDTILYNMINYSAIMPFSADILCRDKKEREVASKIFSNIKVGILDSIPISDVDLSQYTTIYLKYGYDFTKKVAEYSSNIFLQVNLARLLFNHTSEFNYSGNRILRPEIIENINNYNLFNTYYYIQTDNDFFKDGGVWNRNYIFKNLYSIDEMIRGGFIDDKFKEDDE